MVVDLSFPRAAANARGNDSRAYRFTNYTI